MDEFCAAYKEKGVTVNASNVEGILQQEVGKVFCQVLEDAGVFKCNEEGLKEFRRFISIL